MLDRQGFGEIGIRRGEGATELVDPGCLAGEHHHRRLNADIPFEQAGNVETVDTGEHNVQKDEVVGLLTRLVQGIFAGRREIDGKAHFGEPYLHHGTHRFAVVHHEDSLGPLGYWGLGLRDIGDDRRSHVVVDGQLRRELIEIADQIVQGLQDSDCEHWPFDENVIYALKGGRRVICDTDPKYWKGRAPEAAAHLDPSEPARGEILVDDADMGAIRTLLPTDIVLGPRHGKLEGTAKRLLLSVAESAKRNAKLFTLGVGHKSPCCTYIAYNWSAKSAGRLSLLRGAASCRMQVARCQTLAPAARHRTSKWRTHRGVGMGRWGQVVQRSLRLAPVSPIAGTLWLGDKGQHRNIAVPAPHGWQ